MNSFWVNVEANVSEEVGKWNRNMVGILPCSRIGHRTILFGGISGTSFRASGLDQPKARSGSIVTLRKPSAMSK